MSRFKRTLPAFLRSSDPMPLHHRLVVGGWVLMLCAFPWLLLGVGSAVKTATFLAAAEAGVAEVVSSRENPSARGDPTWTTTFALTAPDGTRLAASWTGERGFAPGGAVPVRYRRAPLVRIQPDDHRAAWIWTWVFVGGGRVHVLVGGTMVLVGALLRRRHPDPRPAEAGHRSG